MQNVTPVTLVNLESVCTELACKKTHIYSQVQAGLLPKQVKLGGRCARWVLGEVQAVVVARVAGESDDQIRELVNRLHAARKNGGA
jgi:prophage regulatory protein